MRTERVGALFVRALEPLVGGGDMLFVVRLREAPDPRALGDAFARLVRGMPLLRSRLERIAGTTRHAFVPFTDQVVDRLVDDQSRSLREPSGSTDVLAVAPPGERLPMRLLRLDARTLVVRVDHAFTAAQGGMCWFEALLATLDAEGVPEAFERPSDARGASLMRRARSVARALRWAWEFRRAAGRDAAAATVDLTRGRVIPAPERGFTIVRHIVSPQHAEALVVHARQRGHTLTVDVLLALAAALFSAQPERSRVLAGLTVDLGSELRGVTPWTPGNPASSLLVQLFRNGDHTAVVQDALRALRRGVPLGLACLTDGPLRDEVRAMERFADQARKPLPQRAPFENVSCIVGNLGVPDLAHVQRSCEWVGAGMPTQSVLLALCTVGGSLALQTTFSNDLFDAGEILPLADAVAGSLVGSVGACLSDIERHVVVPPPPVILGG